MLKSILRIIFYFFLIIFIFILSLYSSFLLPYPFENINLVIIFLIILLGLYGSGNIVWGAFLFGVLMDLYSELYFGIFIFSLTISFLLVYWLYYEFFTNKSVWALATMVALEVIFFRIFYIFFIVFNGTKIKLTFLFYFGWELLFTTITAFLLYFLLNKFFTKFKILK
ncbi:MAG: hypothetical protein COY69_02945 [Candidatus Magasanikbacteria bacterium CG_4_10_14_0_8_um_filter_32_14]|uniref:Rod shape-determining protein MreD n=2 Tax=Candidatus Magasanikiibacteriota TaxID=1752731 RepID=A0A2M7R8V8_9BACT|nr:MAG: hypothetical protein AUJ23_01795 [Candidatus Magasanikbacteria bacterium CG1_02_32_51]PIY93195.1 MAG: hypothetical protein COY69_02945 [Candidatus Magasanikbacteria bacterium CG_4_10_14_0_8_um_filter_32_14]